MWRSPALARGAPLPAPYTWGTSRGHVTIPPILNIPTADGSAGEYGLLDLRVLDENELPRDGLLNFSPSSSYVMPVAAASGTPLLIGSSDADSPEVDLSEATRGSGFVGSARPAHRDSVSHAQDIRRAILGLGQVRDDLIEDERGNILAPEVRDLAQDVAAATKADEPALRRRIGEMFPGEPWTANWFYRYLSDILIGDPPEEILEELYYRADERFRDQRVSIANLSSLVGIPAAVVQPRSRPFTHLNDPVPRDPNMEEFRKVMHGYELNQQARALEIARTDPINRQSLRGHQANPQGAEFEGVARGYDTAYGRIVGPRLIVERPDHWREYDHTLLDPFNRLMNPVEVKSGQGRIPKRQREFDATMDPPVVYRKEKDVLADGRKLLRRYDRLWMLRNPPQNLH